MQEKRIDLVNTFQKQKLLPLDSEVCGGTYLKNVVGRQIERVAIRNVPNLLEFKYILHQLFILERFMPKISKYRLQI